MSRMTVADLTAILADADPDAPVEIEIECADGYSRRAFDLRANQWSRRSGPVFIIEGDEPT